MTAERPPVRSAHDVARARAGVDHADVPFGPRRPPPTTRERWGDFVARYGWRAYALPALVVITIVSLVTATGSGSTSAKQPAAQHAKQQTAPPAAPSQIPLKDDSTGNGAQQQALKAAALPAGPAYTVHGKGTYRTLPGTSPVVGHGQLFHYSIQVENGITGVDLTQFQKTVVDTLADKRSWAGHGDVSLQRVDSDNPDFRVTLTSTMTVRKLCGYSIPVETSCYVPAGGNSPVNRVVFNVARWQRGAAAYVGDLNLYRIYMINHEDGHAIGHEHAHQCLPGGLAPAMMQQTFGLKSAQTNKYCEANPWPYPPGAKGAPGKEQPDTPANDEYGLDGDGD
jgi:hypothetical protein